MATLLLGTTVGGFAVIHAGNIASQSVNYANSAGSVAWTNVSGRPTLLSQFTNDLGNYGNWITASALSGYATQSWVQSYYAPRAYVTDSYVDFYIYGDQNKYYPVTIHNWNGGHGMQRYSVSRGYSWQAPWDPIGTGSHKGGLTLTFEWTGDTAWGGNDKTIRIIQFGESYTNMVAGMQLAHCEGVVVWLRGGGSGGAHYRLHGPGGLSQGYTINMSAWTSCAGITYDVRNHESSVVNTEINNRYPVRNNTELFINNNSVATQSWVQTQGYLTSLPSHNHDSLYVPLGRTITINGVTQDLSANRSFTVSTSLPAHNHDDRYYTEGESDGRFTRNLGFQAFVGSLNDLDGQYTVNLDGYGPINGYGGPDTAYNASLWGIGNRNRGAQIYIPYAYDQLYFRRGASDWSSWFRVLNTSADPYPSNMNQYLRTTDSPTFSSAISVTADGVNGYVASRVWLYSHNNYRGAGVYMSGTDSTWFAGTPYTNFDGVYMIGKRNNPSAPDAADPSYRLWQVSNGGSTYQTGDMSSTNVHAYSSSNAKVVAGSWNFDGMLFDSGRPALIARGAYPHLELWADISNSNHGATIRLGGYDNGSSGNYKSWHIGTPGSDLYFMDIAYGGRNNPNPHGGIAGLGDSYGYAGAFNMMRFHNNGNIGVGNFGTYGSGDNTPAYKLDVRGNGRYTQLLYLDAAESLNLYGVRGRFTNEYIHLYNKVGIGHPSGWGQGEGNTPNQGLSTYGGANIGYGTGAGLSVTGLLRIASSDNLYLDTNYGQSIVGVYSAERYQGIFAMGDSYKLAINGTTTGNLYGLAWSHPNAGGVAGNLNTHGLLVMENGTFLAAVSGSIRARDDMRAPYFYGSGSIRLGDMWGGAGLYRPSGSMVFGIENSDWIFSKAAVTQAYFSGGDGNLWMRWAGDWLSNLLGAKQNASTAINTSNIGSQSVNYAASSGTASNVQGYSAYSLITQSRGIHSGSDFPNGTLVRTDIDANGWAGNSFIMEVSGKSYGSGTPFKLIMEGYLYADTIINVSAMSYGSYFPGPVKVMRLDGKVAFWWPRGSYWNSFEVHVRSADGDSWNRAISIGNSDEPAGDKKISITPTQVIHSGNIGSQSVNYASSAGGVAWTNVSGRPTALSQFTNDLTFTSSDTLQSVTNRGASTSNNISVNGVRLGRDFSVSNRGTVRIDSNGTSFPSDILFGHTAAANESSWSGVYWSISSRAAENGNRFTIWRGGANASIPSEAMLLTLEPSGDLGVGAGSSTSQGFRLGGDNAAGGRLYFQYAGDSSYIDSYGGHGAGQRYRDLQIVSRNLTLQSSGGSITLNGSTNLRYSTADADDYNALTFAAGSDDYIIKASSSRGAFGRSSFGWHINSASAFGVYSSGWVQLLGVQGDSGNVFNKGRFVVGGNFNNNPYSSVGSTRLHFGGGDADANNSYYIGTNLQDYNGNYTKLDLRWHTGIRMGARPVYGGIRFFNDETLGSRIMSIGESDANIRIDNNLWIGGAGGWITDLLAAKQNNLGFTPYNSTNPAGYITSSGSITGSAGSVAWGNVTGRPGWLSGGSYITSHSNANDWRDSGFYENEGGGSNWPSQTWYNSINVRHSNQGNYHGFQVAMSYYDNNLWFRSYQGSGTFQSWDYAISSRTIGSQSVNYATSAGSAGNADTVDGKHGTNNAGNLAVYESNGYLYIPSWLNVNGGGIFSGTNNAHLRPNTGAYGSWEMIGSKNGWSGIWFNDSGDYLMANNNEVGHYQNNVGWKFRWFQGTMYISRGTTGGGSEFTVLDSGNFSSWALNRNGDTTSSAINFRTNKGGYLGSLDTAALQVYSDSNNSAFMSFHKGGHYAVNFGLDADNVMRLGGWSAASNRWQLDMSGNMTVAGDVTAYSDARVKTDVKTIENALLKVLNLRGVSYVRTDSEDKNTKIGVIAQETLQVVPEVVNQDAAGMYNVSYGNMVGLLIEAIKEQQKEIDELKAKLN
jgi:hypothetical protein